LIWVTYHFSDVGSIVIERKILGFGVQLEGKGLLQVELGCENNALWKNIDWEY
jgi:hypothetical protein